jgi:glycosyltransferase involved in cell wall biosynthesis
MYKAKQAVGRFVFKKIIKDNYRIITDSNYTKDELVSFSKKSLGKTKVIYLAAETEASPPQKVSIGFESFIMYIGRQSDHKNIKRLGCAHQKLLKAYPDLGLVLVGKKDASADINQEYFNRAEYKNILFTDFLSDREVSWLYKNCSAYVFPSLMEGFGLPGLEAMGYGAPVVSSNATCLPEVYGNAAHYFNPKDTDDMARAIDEVLSNKKLRERLVRTGYQQVKKYSWKKMAEETHALYLKAMRSNE